ncbi:MAG: glycoside hydrolase family 5 protein [Promethearchaeota archaeon]
MQKLTWINLLIIFFILTINGIFPATSIYNYDSQDKSQLSPLFRGVNLGDALDAPQEGAWGVVLQEEYFQLIKDAGFNLIRIPIRWSAHAEKDPPYTIDEVFLERVDWAVNQSLSRGCVTIIDIHHYDEIMIDPQAHKARFLALWQQLSVHYQNYSENLYFELLNEPSSQLNSSLWNQFLQEAINIVRETNDKRMLLVGPTSWNNLSDLDFLSLPQDDPNIMVTFHYYSPFQFTHQGADWVSGSDQWLGTNWTGTPAEKEAIRQDFDAAVQWANDHNRTLFLGEFGAYRKADMDSRVCWTTFIAREAEKRNISWCYWDFCSNFAIYDWILERWIPQLLQALLPESPFLTSTTSTSSTIMSNSTATTNASFISSLFMVLFICILYRKYRKKK